MQALIQKVSDSTERLCHVCHCFAQLWVLNALLVGARAGKAERKDLVDSTEALRRVTLPLRSRVLGSKYLHPRT